MNPQLDIDALFAEFKAPPKKTAAPKPPQDESPQDEPLAELPPEDSADTSPLDDPAFDPDEDAVTPKSADAASTSGPDTTATNTSALLSDDAPPPTDAANSADTPEPSPASNDSIAAPLTDDASSVAPAAAAGQAVEVDLADEPIDTAPETTQPAAAAATTAAADATSNTAGTAEPAAAPASRSSAAELEKITQQLAAEDAPVPKPNKQGADLTAALDLMPQVAAPSSVVSVPKNDLVLHEGEEPEAVNLIGGPNHSQLGGAAASKRTNRLPNMLKLVRQQWKTATACALSMTIGFSLTWFGRSRPETESSLPAKPLVVYTATEARRIEPIAPIVPFAETDNKIVALGERLFHDPALSANGKIACSTCHHVHQGGASHTPLNLRFDGTDTPVNTPTVINAALNSSQTWNGRVATLEEQLHQHVQDPTLMGTDWNRVIKYVSTDMNYKHSFQLYMNADPSQASVTAALQTYLRTLITLDSDFDQWLRGNANLSVDADAGYYLFKQLKCINCHQGANVGGSMLQSIEPLLPHFAKHRELNATDDGLYTITRRDRDRYYLRVPSLRNVEYTAPYLHDGSVAELHDAVALMIETYAGVPANPEDIRRITAFLKTLGGNPEKLNAPLRPTHPGQHGHAHP